MLVDNVALIGFDRLLENGYFTDVEPKAAGGYFKWHFCVQ